MLILYVSLFCKCSCVFLYTSEYSRAYLRLNDFVYELVDFLIVWDSLYSYAIKYKLNQVEMKRDFISLSVI